MFLQRRPLLFISVVSLIILDSLGLKANRSIITTQTHTQCVRINFPRINIVYKNVMIPQCKV